MALMLDDANGGPVPGNPDSFGGKCADEAEHLHRDGLGVLRRESLGDAVPPVPVRQQAPGEKRRSGQYPTGKGALGFGTGDVKSTASSREMMSTACLNMTAMRSLTSTRTSSLGT
jgi:hypothetical protein